MRGIYRSVDQATRWVGYLADAYNPLSIGDIDESFKLAIVAHCLYP